MSFDVPLDILENPRLSDVLRLLGNVVATNLHVACPGRITAYDDETHLAEVQPLVKVKSFDRAQSVDIKPVPDVPVFQLRTARASVLMPIAAGDAVTLLCGDRSLERWKGSTSLATAEAETDRMHDLTDCWAILGGYPEGIPQTPHFPGALEIRVEPGTKIAVTNGNTGTDKIELFTQVDKLVTKLEELVDAVNAMTHTVTGAATVAPPLNFATFDALKLDFTDIKADLGELKP